MNSGVLSKLIIAEIFLLFLQFSLGMWNNLFAEVPLGAPFKFFAYSGGLEVLTHIINGALVLTFSFAIVLYSFKTKNSINLKLSVLAVIFIISAIANGITFLEIFSIPALYNSDNYFSMAMALSFLAVFVVTFSELYVLEKNAKF